MSLPHTYHVPNLPYMELQTPDHFSSGFIWFPHLFPMKMFRCFPTFFQVFTHYPRHFLMGKSAINDWLVPVSG